MARPPRFRLIEKIAVGFLAIWGLASGCNPSVITALGGNPINRVNSPDGYIVILMMNKTTSSINSQVDITKENGTVQRQTLSVGPLFFFASVNDCDVSSIQIINFGYSSPGGVVTSPSNLGALIPGEGLECGKVVAITASGAPPIFSVQVY